MEEQDAGLGAARHGIGCWRPWRLGKKEQGNRGSAQRRAQGLAAMDREVRRNTMDDGEEDVAGGWELLLACKGAGKGTGLRKKKGVGAMAEHREGRAGGHHAQGGGGCGLFGGSLRSLFGLIHDGPHPGGSVLSARR